MMVNSGTSRVARQVPNTWSHVVIEEVVVIEE